MLHVEDDLGNRLRYEPYVRADRSPPSLEWLTLSHVDELNFDHRGRRQDGQPVTRRGRDEIEGSLVRKWQTRWGPDDANPAVLRVKGVPGGVVESPVVGLAWRSALHGRFGPWRELMLIPNRTGEADIVLDAAGLGFDPIGNPPGPGTRPEIEVRVTDRAGNTFVDSLRLELAVIPPALEIEWLDDYRVDGYVRLDEISLEDESFGRIWEGGGGLGVLVGGLRVRNPHGVDVVVGRRGLGGLVVEVHGSAWILDSSGGYLASMGLWPDLTDIPHPGPFLPFAPIGDCVGMLSGDHWVTRLRPEDAQSIGNVLSVFPGDCEALQEVPRNRSTTEVPIMLLGPDQRGGDEVQIAAESVSDVAMVADAAPRPGLPQRALRPEISALVRSNRQRRYLDELQSEPGGLWVVEGSNCTGCFAGEHECEAECQAGGGWFGHRAFVVTDVRVSPSEVRPAIEVEGVAGVIGRNTALTVDEVRLRRVPTRARLPE